jgi:phosphoribosylanthranilate isomerase
MTAQRLSAHVKICGVTRREDAELAVALGASAVGFVFWPRSPRAIAIDAATAIAAALPESVTRVGVFVNATPDEVAAHVDQVGLDVAQLHGDEPAAAYAGVGARVMKAVGLSVEEDVTRAIELPETVMVLVDASDPERRGGTGRTANWPLAVRVASGRAIVLAGGLTAANVAEAVRLVRPWAVDVSSGVEASPGVKDREKMQAFFAAISAAQAEGV